jgi:hypothetical protein
MVKKPCIKNGKNKIHVHNEIKLAEHMQFHHKKGGKK